MEKILSPEEKIKKAEAIYYRRKIEPNTYKIEEVKNNNFIITKKVVLQFGIGILIYILVTSINIEKVKTKVNEILNYNEDFIGIYNNSTNFFKTELEKIKNNKQEFIEVSNEQEASKETLEEISNEEIIQASSEEIVQEENLTQEEKDIRDILNTKSFKLPLKGVITSRFGNRESNNPIVSKYHTGIDIAVNEGTVFISAMEGIVKTVSSEGPYGNHIEIINGDVTTLYAHCSKIYVSEGEQIYQGQNLGEVGETGNATGPHLHFEIIKEDRYVNPEAILEF